MATSSISLVLRKRPNKDGSQPIIIQIIKNRMPSIVHTGQSIFASEWDAESRKVKKSHPNSARLNALLIKRLAEVNDNSLTLETKGEFVTSKKVKNTIKPPAETLFFGQAILYLESLGSAKKYNKFTADRPRIKHFKDFLLNPKIKPTSSEKKKERQDNKKLTDDQRHELLGKYLREKDIPFSSITPGLLDRFSIYLKGLGDKGQRTIVNHLAVIRCIFSFADRNQVIDNKTVSPFGKKGIKIKFPPTKKIGLSAEEVTRLEEVELADNRFDHARNIWLFNYYFAGMRIADSFKLKWCDINDGRLHYSMGKNDKEDSLKIPRKAMVILGKYEPLKRSYNDFVFPDLKNSLYLNDDFYLERQIAFITSRYDKFLQKHVAPAAGIEKDLTMHIARHTFGNISGDKIPPKILQKLYRHSNIQTTMGYQSNFIHKDVDDALDAVIGN